MDAKPDGDDGCDDRTDGEPQHVEDRVGHAGADQRRACRASFGPRGGGIEADHSHITLQTIHPPRTGPVGGTVTVTGAIVLARACTLDPKSEESSRK